MTDPRPARVDEPRGDEAPGDGPATREGDLAARLAANVTQLREARGLSQSRIARAAGLPRATWTHLESGAANPTLSVLARVASVLQISIEELLATPRAAARHYARAELPSQVRGAVVIRRLLPDPIPGVSLERMEFPPRARLAGVPHTPGTTEYLTCESGALLLEAAGEHYRLARGDVVVFRGDQKHAYVNETDKVAVGYSVVLLAAPV